MNRSVEPTGNKAKGDAMQAKGKSPNAEGAGKGGNTQAPGLSPRPKGNVLAVLGRLLGYMRAYRMTSALLILGFLASTALSLLPAYLVRMALDSMLIPNQTKLLWIIAAAMVGAAILQGFLDFITRYYAESRGQLIVYTIRQEVYRHLLGQSFSYFDHSRTGDIMARITDDAQTLQMLFGTSLVYIISHALFLTGILAVLFSWSVKLALLYLCLLPFIFHGMTRYTFRVQPAFRKTRRALGQLTMHVQEQLQGIQVMKLFGREAHAKVQFDRMNEQFRAANVEAGRITAFWMPYVFVVMGIMTGILMWYGGNEVIAGSMSIGTLVGFSTYVGMMMRPIRQTGMLLSQALSAAAAAERIFEVLDAKPEVNDAPGAIPMPQAKGSIRYENVRFSYDKQQPVLKNVSFSIEQGETIAVVGPTGAGKTTLVHLLPRFYEADSGTIYIDDRDIRQFTVNSLRQQIGIVLQQTFLFHASVRDNIAMGKTGATFEEIRKAAKAAQIDEFIMELPLQYDTVIGERGVKLSGGQRQRISIARTLLMDPRILIMDEPTSGVDSRTDESIQAAVDALCRNRTVLIIAHRLWTLKNADRILVLNDGEIQQFGTHEELMKQSGLYKELYMLQMSGEQSGLLSGFAQNEQEVPRA
jgi:ABC-type multidrug transport system fused ATPase/permease subunit